MANDDRPRADPGREEFAKRMFDEGLSPEEYAARNADGFYCFSFDEVRFSDPALDAWIQRFADILFQRNGAPSLRELREKYLTPEEHRTMQRDIQDKIENP
jgi:hypothetical protein